ncbi:hypothetical protein Sste5346_006416 [Sporothrix stenoceras]|uniref:DUF7924 domain-containing protein n=1 Tax=Sporothrix stenoceras TaxID=5173 RepID=A0ABR3YZU9_9PEZI
MSRDPPTPDPKAILHERLNRSILMGVDPPVFPFLVANFLGRRDSMWVAGKKCLLATAACVHMNNILYCLLGHTKVRADIVESTMFAVAMNGNEVQLYVTWADTIGLDEEGNEIDEDNREEDDKEIYDCR